MQVQQRIYLQDYRRHSVAVSQSRNDHMQAYIKIMEGKYNFFIWNGLMVDILTGKIGRLINRLCLCEVPEIGTSVQSFL